LSLGKTIKLFSTESKSTEYLHSNKDFLKLYEFFTLWKIILPICFKVVSEVWHTFDNGYYIILLKCVPTHRDFLHFFCCNTSTILSVCPHHTFCWRLSFDHFTYHHITYSGVLWKWEYFIKMRVAYFAPSVLQKRGVMEGRWLQLVSSHLNENFSF